MSRGKRFFKKRQSIPTEYKGVLYDSQTEAEYSKYLDKNPAILKIELQPVYQIIAPYKVVCRRCEGGGRILNVKTGNLNKCRTCNASGFKSKAGSIYTADFKVTYLDGFSEVIDVKGAPATKDFMLRKRLLESQSGNEVVIVRFKNKEWVRE